MTYKTAVLIAGEPREFKKNYDNFMENIVEPTNADVFISCWDFKKKKRFQDDGTIDEYRKLYDPTIFLCETWDDKQYKKFEPLINKFKKNCREEINPEAVLGFNYKLHQCNYLRQQYELMHDIRYDIIIKWRTEFTCDWRFDKQFQRMAIDNLMIPCGHDSLGINDLCFFAPSEYANKYCDLYYCLEIYANEGIEFHPERYLKHHLEQCKIKPYRFQFPMQLRGKKTNI